jgi:hypothetical protein
VNLLLTARVYEKFNYYSLLESMIAAQFVGLVKPTPKQLRINEHQKTNEK